MVEIAKNDKKGHFSDTKSYLDIYNGDFVCFKLYLAVFQAFDPKYNYWDTWKCKKYFIFLILT